MKRFMETNEVTHNLMSFSGFKAILIFSLLVESPKSYKDIQKAIEENEYLHESVSFDTIRIYLNSLRKIGCDISSVKKGHQTLFYIDSHPFELNITDQQVESIIKIYKALSKSIDIGDYMALQQFFIKIAPYVKNEDLKLRLENISPVSNIDPQLIKDLIKYAKLNIGITILYNSPSSGIKEIDIIPDKLSIMNGKLYLLGFNSEYNNYSSFLVSKVMKIISVDINTSKLETPDIVVRYEYLKSDNTVFEPIKEETIIEQADDKIVVEISSKNKFDIMQRVLSLSNRCIVLSPSDFREEVIESLKKMKEGYIGKD